MKLPVVRIHTISRTDNVYIWSQFAFYDRLCVHLLPAVIIERGEDTSYHNLAKTVSSHVQPFVVYTSSYISKALLLNNLALFYDLLFLDRFDFTTIDCGEHLSDNFIQQSLTINSHFQTRHPSTRHSPPSTLSTLVGNLQTGDTALYTVHII